MPKEPSTIDASAEPIVPEEPITIDESAEPIMGAAEFRPLTEFPSAVRLLRHHSWYEDDGRYLQYQAGQIVTDCEEIAELLSHNVTEVV